MLLIYYPQRIIILVTLPSIIISYFSSGMSHIIYLEGTLLVNQVRQARQRDLPRRPLEMWATRDAHGRRLWNATYQTLRI